MQRVRYAVSLAERVNGEFARVILSVTQRHTIRMCPQETPSSATGASIVLGASMPIWAIGVPPSARTEDIGPHIGAIDRVAVSQREQSVAAEGTLQQTIMVMQAENAKALFAVMEGVRDNTTAVAPRDGVHQLARG